MLFYSTFKLPNIIIIWTKNSPIAILKDEKKEKRLDGKGENKYQKNKKERKTDDWVKKESWRDRD